MYHELGRLYAPDPRDQYHLMATVLAEEQPLLRSVSYRSWHVLDQGQTPSCVGHGWRAWLDGAPVMDKSGPTALNIYYEAQKVDEWPGEGYEGTSVRAGAKVLFDLKYINEYVWAFDEPTIRKWLLSNSGGVVIGVNWYQNMFSPDPQGFLNVNGTLAGGHCLWVRGYNRPRDAYRLQNSWGTSWGQNGQAWLRSSDMARLIAEEGEVCCGTEVRLPR